VIPIAGQAILTAAQMRAAEAAAASNGEALYALMERAGAGVADAVRRVAAGSPVLVLCGPGNNGGDGYVAARVLQSQGVSVRVAASGPPKTDLARRAAEAWNGSCESLDDAEPAPILVDALFGAGPLRPISAGLCEEFSYFSRRARYRVAVDLPSGLDADTGDSLMEKARSDPEADLTLATGALKPAHVLPSAPARCGEVRVIDIGLDLARAPMRVVGRPDIPQPTSDTHKYSRGMVAVIAGEMPGAAILAATAAQRAGAGYVAVFGEAGGGPAALVHRPFSVAALGDERIGAIVVGPGLGRSEAAKERLAQVLAVSTFASLVMDADALALFDPEALADRRGAVIITPHFGELWALKKRLGIRHVEGVDRFTASFALGAALPGVYLTLVDKGATTVVTSHQGVRVAPRGSSWLSTAGTGDVLAGAIGAMAAAYSQRGRSALDAAAAGVWLHAEAARKLGSNFIADDLAMALSAARASL
jgi:hydroxyethylthiazole kinase-like uncharacterized protein yjeF